MGTKVGGNSKKKGRNKVECTAYKLGQRAERNKIRRLTKRLAQHPNDRAAANRLAELKKVVGVRSEAATAGRQS